MDDLSRVRLFSQTAFGSELWIEPGESIHDSKVFQIDLPWEEIVWLMVNLRVESADRVWSLTRHVRVEIVNRAGVGHECHIQWTAYSKRRD